MNETITSFAKRFGEERLEAVSGFKTKVFLGERLVFKIEPERQEEIVLRLLKQCLPETQRKLVPQIVASETVDGIHITAQTRIRGTSPTKIAECVAKQLGVFLQTLHNSTEHSDITELNGSEEKDFASYVRKSLQAYITKLKTLVDENDKNLILRAETEANEILKTLPVPTSFVLVHKDIFAHNILVDPDDNLTGVIDWNAAQMLPREWEFAVIRQRLPEVYNAACAAYERPIDQNMLDLCSIVQSLRFWKSFPRQEDFVREQRDHISKVLVRRQ